MFRRKRSQQSSAPEVPLYNPEVEAVDYVKVISHAKRYLDKSGRAYSAFTDTSTIRTKTGQISTGCRSINLFDAHGSAEEQADNPFLRQGAVLVLRANDDDGPLTGGVLRLMRSPDSEGDYHPPRMDNLITSRHPTLPRGVVSVIPDEAFAAMLFFDELYFGPNNTEYLKDAVDRTAILATQGLILGIAQGFRPETYGDPDLGSSLY
jgi:hypothetical protein